MKKRHLIILMTLLLAGLNANAHIFVDPIDGDNTKNGTDYANRVKTIDKAITLSKAEIENEGTNSWIVVCNPITISSDMTLDGATNKTWTIHLKRCASGYCYFDGNIIEVAAGKKLTLQNIVIDGTGFGNGGTYMYTNSGHGCGTLVFLEKGSTLTINAGTVLQKNHRLYAENAPYDPSALSPTPVYNGGAIESTAGATVVMNGGRITDCKASSRGGGIYLNSDDATSDGEASSFTMSDGEITNCEAYASNAGGGVCVFGKKKKVGDDYVYYLASVALHKGKVHECFAAVHEAVYNFSIGRGGGLLFGNAEVDMDGDEMLIYKNQAKRYGGAIQIEAGCTFNFSKGKIYENIAYNDTESSYHEVSSGGAAFHVTANRDADRHSRLNMTGGQVYKNKALNGYGGAIHSSGAGDLYITGGKIYDNEAKYGGAINMQYLHRLEFESNATVEVYNNKAKNGGAISFDGGTMVINGGSFHDNKATGTSSDEDTYGLGGAFYIHTDNDGNTATSTFEMHGGSVYDNEADNDGGAIYIRQPRKVGLESLCSDVLIEGGLLSGNSAGNNGGALYVNQGNLTLQGSDLINNTAGNAGGGIYFDASSTMTVGDGDMNISGNTVNSVPNNLYLPTGKTIEVISGSFDPEYLGIYTQATATALSPIPVFTVSNAANYTYLESIYNGMTGGTMNVVDDRQIHSAQYISPQTTLYFGIGSPWSPLQQTARASDLGTTVNDFYEIGNVKQLTAFLWKVNGISTHETSFTSPVSNLKGKLIADIDMTGHYWMPFANYQGTFDGNGHTITGLVMVPTNASTGRGLFGTTAAGADIKNVALDDCQFYAPTSGSCYVGSIVSNLAAGTVSNSVVNPGTQLFATGNTSAILGGIAGQVSGGTLHSSIAMAEMTGYQMGGLVGANSGDLYNSYAYPKFDHKGGSTYFGGLVGVNTGRVENCYSRVQGTAPTSTYFGWLAGNNTSASDKGLYYSYSPNATYVATALGTTSGNQTGLSTFGVTVANAYDYRVRDNQVAATNAYAPTYDAHHLADYQLKKYLNKWVDTKNGSSSTYAGWTRPTTQAINGDYPLLKLSGFNAVAATSGEVGLDYGDINSLLTSHATANNTILFYGSKAGVNSNSGSAAPLYIDEDAVLTQNNGTIQAYVGVTLDNSACHNGANPTFGGGTVDYTDWHFFSSALTAAPIGIDYNNDNMEYKYNENSLLPKYQFTSANGYFPTSVYGGTYETNYYPDWDLYAYYEPDYHWINFKRNGNSHWHEDLMPGDPEENRAKINYKSNGTGADYTNETNFIPGRGYMVALKEEGYLQAYGTLITGNNITVPVTYTTDVEWTTREGQNLLGNPYQSYLDFNAFAANTDNAALWTGSEDGPFYIIMDEDEADYVTYYVNQSSNTNRASRYLHPHQGFMIKVKQGGTAYFTDGMRTISTGSETSTFRGDGQTNYPLVNLFAKDSHGNRDMVTVELGRPDKGGLLKSHVPGTSTGSLYCRYEEKDYDLAFTEPGLAEAAIRFTTKEDGEYTMTWNTQNGDFSYLHLIDNLTGTDIDCLTTDEYKFSALTSDYESRFRLVFDYTGIEENGEDDASAGSASFAYISNGIIVIDGTGTLQVIDLLGRQILSKEIPTLNSQLSTLNFPAGIYLLRLTGVNGSKTQKIVIP